MNHQPAEAQDQRDRQNDDGVGYEWPDWREPRDKWQRRREPHQETVERGVPALAQHGPYFHGGIGRRGGDEHSVNGVAEIGDSQQEWYGDEAADDPEGQWSD